jgi:hypothetical protein
VNTTVASISPLLANLYLNRFLKYFRLQGKSKIWRAEIVSYADDFVILTQRCVQQWAAHQRRASTILRQPAWEFSDLSPLTLVALAD